MSLPQSHPAVHQHKGLSCPVSGKLHEYCPPQAGDSRSACPALNTMANHGYIARDGKNISAFDLIRGLKACYGLSTPLAVFLSVVGFIILKKVRNISLFEIGKHNAIEHDASLVHHDTPQGQEYAPIDIDQTLVGRLIADAKTGREQGEGPEAGDTRILMDATDVARARVRREKECRPIDSVHAEIARGEMGIILGVWETKTHDNVGIPVEWMRRWIGSERLPDGWKPDHVQGLLDVVKRSKAIRTAMDEMKKNEAIANGDEKAKL
ncbi:Chloroperoxidase [Crucibulum laeve]|uniref:Chloroperoxidase n=1 Tax=Crucibulum laeve TaxID=68775 RepID=A0A5C3LMF6_9AGAR|nr:Chloroperoxidase [Crucibulum laeve]